MVYGRAITFFLVNFIITLAGISSFGAGQSVTLGWNASASIDTAGYHLYYGGASGDYTNTLDVGDATIATVPDLTSGATYFFAVTAYDGIGLESAFSGEISYTVPAGAVLAAQALAAGQMVLTGLGPAGYVYDIQASGDLRNWNRTTSVTMDANGTFQFTIPNITSSAVHWYRLKQTSP